MLRVHLASVLALALSACAGTVATPPTTPVVAGITAKADTVILTGERGFAAAEIAYTAAANGVGRLVDQGLIRGATAIRLRRQP